MIEKNTWMIKPPRYDHGISIVWFCRDKSEESNHIEEALRVKHINYLSFELNNSNISSPFIQIDSSSGRKYEFFGYEEIYRNFFGFLDREGCFL